MSPVWNNWARTVRCRPLSIHDPATEAELSDLIQQASHAGEPCKVVGAGHSPAPIAGNDGARLIRLDRLSHAPTNSAGNIQSNAESRIDVDANTATVRVPAGMRLLELNELLADRGLALANLGSISSQSIAGAIATGTHGSGREQPGLADQVAGLRLLTSTGATIELPEVDARLDAARVHLGALGIVTEARLRTVPAFRLHAKEETLPLDAVFERLEEFLKEPYFRFWWFPWTKFARIWRAEKSEGPADPASGPLRAWWNDSVRGNRLPETLYAFAGRRPGSVRAVNRLLRRLLFSKPVERIDRSDRIFNFLIQVRQYVMEYAIPIEHTRDALLGLKDLIETNNFGAHLPVEVRFTPPARGWLDMAASRATCYIGVIMYRPFDRDVAYDDYFRAVDDFMREFSGRPHWAKVHYRDAAELRALYPRFDDFAALRQELDPGGMFMNDYLRRFF